MKDKRFYVRFLAGIALAILLSPVWLTQVPCQATEVRYPIPCYEGEELAKVREWEKEWVGKKFDETKLDELEKVKEFIPETWYPLLTDPERWGPWDFTIEPYRVYTPTPGDIKFTKQYAGTCKIDENDKLLNWVAAIPFPNPKTALEVMYNYDNNNFGDNNYSYQDVYIIDGRRKYDRQLVIATNFFHFANRREVPPVPNVTPNKKGIYRANHTEYFEPASFKGMRGMQIKWIDRTRDWGSWSFSSATRRINRRSTAQRQDGVGGADACFDDQLGYNYCVNVQKYKLLGRKEYLLSRHQDRAKLNEGHVEGMTNFKNVTRERIKTWAIEAVHQDPNYLYTKSIYYIDPEFYYILYAEKWDRRGRLWKIMDIQCDVIKSIYNDSEVAIGINPYCIDVQRVHSSAAAGGKSILGETGEFYEPAYYQPRALLKHGY